MPTYSILLTSSAPGTAPKRVEATASTRLSAARSSLDYFREYSAAEVTHIITAAGDAREIPHLTVT